MAYVEIKDFKSGLDTRRPHIVGEAGTLVTCTNAHITRGGDVETNKIFDLDVELPEGTFGLHSNQNRLYVFGSMASPVNLPGKVVYQQLAHPTLANMIALLWAENFDGAVYTIAEFDDGSVYHYQDGSRVTDWDTKAGDIADNAAVASYLSDKLDILTEFTSTAVGLVITITAAVPGTAFTISQVVSGTGTLSISQLQANQAAVAEVRATGSFTVTGGFPEEDNAIDVINAGATELIEDPVLYILDNDATALACATAINALTETHGYTAEAAGAVVTISAPEGTGATANGTVLTVTPSNVLVTVGSVTNFASGVTEVEARPQIEQVTVGGTYADANTYTVVLNGTDYRITGLAAGYGRICRTFKDKMYSAVKALAVFSAVGDPTAVSSGTGIGFINLSSQDQGSQRLTAFNAYQNLLAAFSAETIQIWAMDVDPDLNALRQVLQGTGTRSPKAVFGYGNSDVGYLSDTGIRSLRARDSSNNAAVDDIGTRIDDEVIAYMATLTETQIANACSITDPKDGRAWVSVGERIYVFSYFPGSKISAWSRYEPGFEIDYLATASKRLYARSGNNIYAYGGASGNEYPGEDDVTVTLQLPFIDAKRIAGTKRIKGVDVICDGEWSINLLLDPNDETKMTETLVVSGSTTLIGRIAVLASTTHFAPKLTSTQGGRQTLSSVVVHFEDSGTT